MSCRRAGADGVRMDGMPELTLGWRLTMTLEYAGIQSGEIAQKLGFSRATVSRWLDDVGAPPKPVTLNVWAELTGVSPTWLRTGVGTRHFAAYHLDGA